jgi:hypothetical protein
MEEMGNAYKIFFRKPEWKRHGVILKQILNKWDELWTGCMWLRIGSSSRTFCMW